MKTTAYSLFLWILSCGALVAQEVELAVDPEKDALDNGAAVPEVVTEKSTDLDAAAEKAGTLERSEKAPQIKRETPDPTQNQLSKVPAEEKSALSTHMQRASVFVRGIRLQEALDELYQAEAIANKYKAEFYQLHNLKGAVYTKMREFDQARTEFLDSIKLDPESFHPKFNLAELEFVEKKWVEAEKAFNALINRYGNKPIDQDPEIELTTERLMNFKVLICMLMQGRDQDAQGLMAKFNYLEDNPAFYYGNAAIEFAKGNQEEAQTWLESAKRIYDAPILEVFVDSLVEVGWVETL